KTCLIEFEDRYFRYHPGVNPVSLARAMMQNIKAGRVVSGGSTLTMQTVRLMRKNRRTYFEKFIEIILATRLELSCSKNKIIALYASHAPMGGNVVGLDAAAWRYFGHDAQSLSWAEAATLAVLPNSPSLMHFAKNREGLLVKRNRLLQNYSIPAPSLKPTICWPSPSHCPKIRIRCHKSPRIWLPGFTCLSRVLTCNLPSTRACSFKPMMSWSGGTPNFRRTIF
ncbi:MAG: transglycosylase domain-containing protein, partial [Petrimonas sp.]|nr:transglycosylase domain-containing protein [Petrimonas sp.]